MSKPTTPQQVLTRKIASLQDYGDLTEAARPYTQSLAMATTLLNDHERDFGLVFVGLRTGQLDDLQIALSAYEKAGLTDAEHIDVQDALVAVYEAIKALGLPS